MIKITKVSTNYDELLNEVDANHGITTVSMGQLKQFHGKRRLGKHVNSGISRQLVARGLNHQPKKLPNRQEGLVRVFKKGSPAASVITAVLAVRPQNDVVIRRAAAAAHMT